MTTINSPSISIVSKTVDQFPSLPPSPPPIFLQQPPKQAMADDEDNSSTQYDLNNKIMRAAVISLAVVIVLVIMLHIYARCLLRRQARRQATMYRLRLSLNHVRGSTEPPPKAGLDPSVIALLPTFIFKKMNQDTKTTELECSVCLSALEEGEMVRVLPNCDHIFHVECIEKWLSSNSTCPLCRAEAEPPDPSEQIESSTLPPAPPLESVGSSVLCVEGSSGGAARAPSKISGSGSRLSSFRRMLSRERSSRRIQPQEDVTEDVERQ